MTKRIIFLGIGAIAIFVILLTVVADLMQTNPPVVKEPTWDSPQTRALAVRACFDCHSNETNYPWYDKLPVSSWLVVFDTVRGRNRLNFSEWGVQPLRGEGEGGGGEGGGRGGNEMRRVIENGSMPPAIYVPLHPYAALTDAEKQQLITGLENSLK
jgi:hypothetical protein